VAIIGYGKAGSRELTANSDLDLVLVYDAPGEAWSDGEKSLMTSEYYARLTQRLVAALSAPMRAGTLYEVDLRLRPSGKKGPVAASLPAFRDYFASDESDLWEHLALSRARVLTGDPELAEALSASIRALVAKPRDGAHVKRETASMRALMHTEKPGRDRFDVKDRPGGLVDLEFITQAFALIHAGASPALAAGNTRARLAAAGEAGLLTPDETETMLAAWDVQLGFQQVARLVLPGAFAESETSPNLRRQIARLLDYPDFPQLSADLDRLQHEVRAIFVRRIGAVK
jgi:[glutamine synthetase] adenylyltransferase / [glutamine synthetase]-adenylyl-L-tyrosine phosphorylase